MLDSLKAGQKIRCTVTRDIRVPRHAATVERLMRQDDDIKRRLKKAQVYRMANLLVKSRGNRPWECRVKSARHAVAGKGATWTMRFIPQVLNDFKSIEQYLKVEAA
ncbi:MAG: hypothetical protein J0L61_01295 [Planctomycetes bacterium]|nr:hypothetical protein [Planctomycetota bacterium]